MHSHKPHEAIASMEDDSEVQSTPKSHSSSSRLAIDHGRCIGLLGVGDSIGEASFALGTRRSTTIVSREPCVMVVVDSDFIDSDLQYELSRYFLMVDGFPKALQSYDNPRSRSEFEHCKVIAYIKSNPFFMCLSKEMQLAVAKLCTGVVAEANQVIQTQNDKKRMISIVDAGSVQLYQVSHSWRRARQLCRRSYALRLGEDMKSI